MKNDYGFSFEPNELSICYSIEGGNSHFGNIAINIPKSEWKPVEMLLEIVSLPDGLTSEQTRKSLVGEKFPLQISTFYKDNAHRKKEGILIPSKDVAETLKKSGKEESSIFFSSLNDYVTFNSECYKLL
jgi:hypothetical protein